MDLQFVQKKIMVAIQAAGNPVSLTWLVERLESDNAALRIGAVHTLERIARDTAESHWPIMEFFCDLLHERIPWQEASRPAPLADAPELHAVLAVLGRRARMHEYGKELRLNLTDLDLRGANLVGAHLERCLLNGSHLDGAMLGACHLEYSMCDGVVFNDAWIGRASLLGASLRRSSFIGARLVRTIFSGAALQDARFDGVDLREARGLTRPQMALAITDRKTLWPTYFETEAGVH
jgi:hypothetical protein